MCDTWWIYGSRFKCRRVDALVGKEFSSRDFEEKILTIRQGIVRFLHQGFNYWIWCRKGLVGVVLLPGDMVWFFTEFGWDWWCQFIITFNCPFMMFRAKTPTIIFASCVILSACAFPIQMELKVLCISVFASRKHQFIWKPSLSTKKKPILCSKSTTSNKLYPLCYKHEGLFVIKIKKIKKKNKKKKIINKNFYDSLSK